MEFNNPQVHAEVTAAFEAYETALVSNDVDMLDELFWASPEVVRYGATECLYGQEEILAFRKERPSAGLDRKLTRTVITTFGQDFATASTEFQRPDTESVERQQQTWVRLAEGWRVVAAQVSLMAAPD
ncbi:MAG: oxalurate catabolism protein HpxZ [Pseudomonadota bacterium]